MSRRIGWPVLLLFSAFASADQVTVDRDPRGGTKRLERSHHSRAFPRFAPMVRMSWVPMKCPIARNDIQDPRKTLNGAHRV